MTEWRVKVYFVADGPVQKADGLLTVEATSQANAIKQAVELASEHPLFMDMVFHRATARELKKRKKTRL